jgi:hypothetical protein
MLDIISGWYNDWFRDTDPEVIARAEHRMSFCIVCPSLDIEGKTCAESLGIKLKGPCCGECGCPLKKKSKSNKAVCPLEKW